MSAPIKVVKTKLFIGNLDQATQPSELSELFAPFGDVLEASVIKDYGFVHYGTIEEAEKAVAALNNKEFHNKRLRVELSTSTVRHRPGQPEPASALRNSRARAAAMASGNGVSRYSPAATTGGVGPMRHSASAWVRSDARPYDGIPIDPNTMVPAYGPASSAYDRSRPYDVRSDPRSYYGDRRDTGYGPGYDISRDNPYGAPGYANVGGAGSGGGSGQEGMYPMHDYRELPSHARADSMGYGANRMYDRNQGTSPVDPYYAGGLPQGPPTHVDPYHNYDPYQKYYANRPRDAEFPVSTSQNPSSRDYDVYSNYRGDPYATVSNQAPPLRHDYAVAYQQQPPPPPPPPPPQQQAGYPPPLPPSSQQRQQQQAYGNASGTPAQSYPPALAQYYGAQQRA